MKLLTNPKLSLQAKGLYELLSRLDLSKLTQRKLFKLSSNGQGSTRTALNELRKCGLLKMNRYDFNKVSYSLKRPETSKDVDVACMIIILLRNNGILTPINHHFNNYILRMVVNGATLYEFIDAVKIYLIILNLGQSNKYVNDYKCNVAHYNPNIHEPMSYIIRIVNKGQVASDLISMEAVNRYYISPKTAKDFQDLKDSDKNINVDDWVLNSDLRRENIDVFRSNVYMKYNAPIKQLRYKYAIKWAKDCENRNFATF